MKSAGKTGGRRAFEALRMPRLRQVPLKLSEADLNHKSARYVHVECIEAAFRARGMLYLGRQRSNVERQAKKPCFMTNMAEICQPFVDFT